MAKLFPVARVSLIGHVSPSVLAIVPAGLLKKHRAVPIAYEAGRGRGTLVVAMSNPHDLAALDELTFASGLTVRPVLADEREIPQTSRVGTERRARAA